MTSKGGSYVLDDALVILDGYIDKVVLWRAIGTMNAAGYRTASMFSG